MFCRLNGVCKYRMIEVSNMLIMAVIATTISGIGMFIQVTVKLVISMFVNVIVVDNMYDVASLDRIFFRYGWSSSRAMCEKLFPSDGIHVCLTIPGFIVGHRYRGGGERHNYTCYNMYVVSNSTLKTMMQMIRGDSNNMIVQYMYYPNQYRVNRAIVYEPVLKMSYAWQEQIANEIVMRFEVYGHVGALLVGSPGLGKSKVADVVMAMLITKGSTPMLVRNFDALAPGCLIDESIGVPDVGEPTVLLINEYDSVAKKAESGTDDKKNTCLAKDRASWLNCLDRFECTKGLIVIATANCELSQFDRAYVRTGRFDVHASIKGDAEMANNAVVTLGYTV